MLLGTRKKGWRSSPASHRRFLLPLLLLLLLSTIVITIIIITIGSVGQTVWPTAVQLHTKLRRYGGTGEDGDIHLEDWTFSVAALEKRDEEKTINSWSCFSVLQACRNVIKCPKGSDEVGPCEPKRQCARTFPSESICPEGMTCCTTNCGARCRIPDYL